MEPDTTASVSINGEAVPVPLAIGQNGTLTFTGTQNQTVTVHASGNTFGSGSVFVQLVSSDGETVLSPVQHSRPGVGFTGGAVADAEDTATYTIRINPTNAAGTLNISVKWVISRQPGRFR